MTYGSGQTILDTDYNQFASDVNDVYSTGSSDYGYGQSAVSTVADGTTITATHWTTLFAAIHACATHQGTSTGTVPASVSSGNTITAYSDLATVITNIRTNRLNLAGGQSTTTSSGTKLTSTRNTSWTNQLEHIFTVTFASANAARHFFNSGGQIKFSGVRSGGTASSQNTSWTNLLSGIGSVSFDYTATTTSGSGTPAAIGFYDLTGSYQQIFTHTGVTTYTGDTYTIYAKSNSSTVIQFRIVFTDASDGVVDDVVDGTISSYIDERRSTGAITIASPTFATVTELTAGT